MVPSKSAHFLQDGSFLNALQLYPKDVVFKDEVQVLFPYRQCRLSSSFHLRHQMVVLLSLAAVAGAGILLMFPQLPGDLRCTQGECDGILSPNRELKLDG